MLMNKHIINQPQNKFHLPRLIQSNKLRNGCKNKYSQRQSPLSSPTTNRSRTTLFNDCRGTFNLLQQVKNAYDLQNVKTNQTQSIKVKNIKKDIKYFEQAKKKQKKIAPPNIFSKTKENYQPYQTERNDDRDVVSHFGDNFLERKISVQEIFLTIKPPHRHRTEMVAYKNSLILFGGIGCQKHLTWAKLTVGQKQQINVTVPNNTDSLLSSKCFNYLFLIESTSFYGHTMKSFKNNAFIFGGVNGDVLNDLLIMNLKTLQLKLGTPAPFRRKEHAATMVGRFMVIHGGIQENQNRNNLFFYDTDLQKWHTLPSNNLPYLSHHKMITLPIKSKKRMSYISENNDQIYMFGGKNQKNQPSNKIYRLKILSYFQVFFQEVKINMSLSDPIPRKRFSCCFEYVQNGNCLLYGGKQNQETYDQITKNGTFNDIHIFNIHKKVWIRQEVKVDYRQGMGSFSSNGKVYVYGGFGEELYADGNILMMKMSENGSFLDILPHQDFGTKESLASKTSV